MLYFQIDHSARPTAAPATAVWDQSHSRRVNISTAAAAAMVPVLTIALLLAVAGPAAATVKCTSFTAELQPGVPPGGCNSAVLDASALYAGTTTETCVTFTAVFNTTTYAAYAQPVISGSTITFFAGEAPRRDGQPNVRAGVAP